MANVDPLTSEQMAAWRPNLLSWKIIDRELERQLQRDFGVPHAYYAILVALQERGTGSLPLTKLAHDLDYSQSRMSHAVAKLEELGWVEHARDASDKRIKALRLTNAGREAYREASVGHLAVVREVFFSHLNDEDLVDLTRIGQKMLRGLGTDGSLSARSHDSDLSTEV